jgi:hypothetical protein
MVCVFEEKVAAALDITSGWQLGGGGGFLV